MGPDDIPFSVSTNGILAFRSGNSVDGQLVWFDREGNETRRVHQPLSGEYLNPSISPDGQQIAVNRKDPATENVDIWLIDVGTDIPKRLTSTPSFDADPVWSPNSQEIAFSSYRNGKWGLWKKNISTDREESLWEAAEGVGRLIAMDWSQDGAFILFDLAQDVWVLPLSGDDPWPLLNDPSDNERAAHFSPDGEWVAYISTEAGGGSIYVARFPDASDGRRVSDGLGGHPRWRSDGRELFYKSGGGGAPLMAVRVDAGTEGLEFGRAVPVFDSAVLGMIDSRHQHAVTGDGNSFLLRRPSLDPPPVTIIVNWTAELENQ